MTSPPLDAEWLEADARGGFASGTVGGERTRRYHALLLTATTPPTGRVVLVNGLETWLTRPSGRLPLSTQRYGPDVVHPRGVDHLAGFAHEPWPTWTFRFADGTEIVHECVVDRADGTVALTWRRTAGSGAASLAVRPLISGRDYHALMRENAAFDFAARVAGGNVGWRPYGSLPAIAALASGRYAHEPDWYRNFLYREEAARGLDCAEDLGSPGTFTFDFADGDATLVLRAGDDLAGDARTQAARIRNAEAQRRAPLAPLARAADAFVVRRGKGNTVVAGFPWFCDWGRDTFIAMRGLVLARGQYDVAASILTAWAGSVSDGMLPNRFPDRGEAPEYNAVDASLWFVVVVHEFLAAAAPAAGIRGPLIAASEAILDGYARGTRFGIRMADDGLVACGVPGVQLTWMDAKVGDRVITPRIGKPVEVQALWINALRLAGGSYAAMAERAQAAFRSRFPNPDGLFDVVDADHVAGRDDASVRPNQVFAVGGLPYAVIDGEAARRVVATVERDLVTPAGLRSLSPSDPAYRPRYEGGVAARDGAYHQGTAWPWLTGAFVDAWLNVNGDTAANRDVARSRFVAPLAARLAMYGLGHLCEIADGDAPHAPRGCPFQAWSLGELIRAQARTAG
ncbi:MAG: amylo-alpha-1,6-glucosidase [Burkholderiales bacterium]